MMPCGCVVETSGLVRTSARRENEGNSRDNACPPANGAERRSDNAPAHGARANHFPASVSVDEGNGSPHSCGWRTAPKAAATQKKRTKSDSILFAFGGDYRTCKDEQREDGIAKRGNECPSCSDARSPTNGAERRSCKSTFERDGCKPFSRKFRR